MSDTIQDMVVDLSMIDPKNAKKVLLNELIQRTRFVWVTKEGKRIDVKDLSSDHIKAILKMLDRHQDTQEIIQENQDGLHGS